jgi:hypothetical protein
MVTHIYGFLTNSTTTSINGQIVNLLNVPNCIRSNTIRPSQECFLSKDRIFIFFYLRYVLENESYNSYIYKMLGYYQTKKKREKEKRIQLLFNLLKFC